MKLSEALDLLPDDQAQHVLGRMQTQWRGARIYITWDAAKLREGATGAAPRFARDLIEAVEGAGSSRADARAVLLTLVGTYVWV